MTTSNTYTTSSWKCSCNHDNPLRLKRCKTCGDTISENILNQIYKEEMHVQNITHAKEEEKRTIILIVIGCVCLFFAPVIIKLLIWILKLAIFVAGAFTGILSILNEYKKMKNVEIIQANRSKWFFPVSVMCFFVLVFGLNAWMNTSKIILGIMTISWLIFTVLHSIRVAKKKYNMSIPRDIMWCGIKFLLVVLIFVRTITS